MGEKSLEDEGFLSNIAIRKPQRKYFFINSEDSIIMNGSVKIRSALISVYHKDGLEPWLTALQEQGVKIFSTGGTYDYIKGLGMEVSSVESVTSYPSVLGGRVKTLHPGIFGGILYRRNHAADLTEIDQYGIPSIDLVIVDLYPFRETLLRSDDQQEIIEKIDIGGISLIRAAAKNFAHVAIIPSVEDYTKALEWFCAGEGSFTNDQRAFLAARAFAVSSAYDVAICEYFAGLSGQEPLRIAEDRVAGLRYGENPHQKGLFYGNMNACFHKLHGKEISYNNLLDIDAALALIAEFEDTTFAVIKHNNACGLASHPDPTEAWRRALAGDPVSAYGGVIVTNASVDEETATEVDKLFFEIILAPAYENNALNILSSRKNRIILQTTGQSLPSRQLRTVLGGVLAQHRDSVTTALNQWEVRTLKAPSAQESMDLVFANKIVKHLKSNAIVLARNLQLIGCGAGQTSRVDALKQSIEKAKGFGFLLDGAVMASDAFFPFADSVEMAHKAGVTAVIQPGGSVRDQDSVAYCDQNSLAMVFTGTRHFKH